jgi:hypothetical protein
MTKNRRFQLAKNPPLFFSIQSQCKIDRPLSFNAADKNAICAEKDKGQQGNEREKERGQG